MDLIDTDTLVETETSRPTSEVVQALVEERFVESEVFQFIRLPSKRKFFENKEESLNNDKDNNINMENEKNQRGNSEFAVHPEQIKIQDQPQKPDVPEEGLEIKYVSDIIKTDNNYVSNPVYAPTTTPTTPGPGAVAYSKLAFATAQKIAFEYPEKGENSAKTTKVLLPSNEETVQEALFAVFFSSFYLIFTMGIFYSHYAEGRKYAAWLTLLILAFSSVVLHVCYLFNGKIKKGHIWQSSKLFTLFTLIPGVLSISLTLADLIFALKERRSRSYMRPWVNTRAIYLVESLFLVLPQCLLQAVLLLEDINSIPSPKGLIVMFGCAILVLGITFARVRYDSDGRMDRFGSGVDRIVRCTIVFGNKGLWVITFVILVVTIRIRFAENNLFTTIIALTGITLLYEVPILLPALSCCNRCVAKSSIMFFFIPQFASLVVVILWTNTDLNIYTTSVGICALGAYTFCESLALMGWLLDSCSDREMDILPIYPHIFGDLYASKNPKKQHAHA